MLSNTLIKVLYYGVSGVGFNQKNISQRNQVGYDIGGGIMNCTLYIAYNRQDL